MTVNLHPSEEGVHLYQLEEYNKVFKHEVWCIPYYSAPSQGEGTMLMFYLYPNCGPVHEKKPMDNCCHPLDEEA